MSVAVCVSNTLPASPCWSVVVVVVTRLTSRKVRSRRPGDRLAGRSRKVQDVLVDAKVPRRERDAWPLVATEDGAVVAVPGLETAPGWEGTVRVRREPA